MARAGVLIALLLFLGGVTAWKSDAPASQGQTAGSGARMGAFAASEGNGSRSRAAPGRHAQLNVPPTPQQSAADGVGSVATVKGDATVTRNGGSNALKVGDAIFNGDVLETGRCAALGITFDDESTFQLTANVRLTVDEFVYEEGGAKNSALFKIVRGTVAFVANQVAKTGDMKIDTPTAILGIRGTTGLVDIPESAATPGGTGQVAIKLYPDADGAVGRMEVFAPGGGAQLGVLSRGATGFAIRAGGPGRFTAVPLRISPVEAARDRAIVRQVFSTHSVGQRMVRERRSQRQPGMRPQQPNRLQQPNRQRQPNRLQQPNRQPTGPGIGPKSQKQQPPQRQRELQGRHPAQAKPQQRPPNRKPPAAKPKRRP